MGVALGVRHLRSEFRSVFLLEDACSEGEAQCFRLSVHIREERRNTPLSDLFFSAPSDLPHARTLPSLFFSRSNLPPGVAENPPCRNYLDPPFFYRLKLIFMHFTISTPND